MSEIKPIAYDGFCGLGGWTEGLLAAGYDVTGFDIEAHEYDDQKYPAKLVIRDVLSIHGSELADASLLVFSPPCQEYSYMAMPFSRGKSIAKALRGEGKFPDGYTGSRTVEQLNALFNACFRIQREASEAAGRHIPMVVENVKGAQPWVGRARANYGSFYLWGDIDMVGDRIIAGGLRWESVKGAKRGAQKGRTNFHFYEQTGMPSPSFHGAEHEPSVARAIGIKTTGHVNKRDGHSHTRHLTNQRESDAVHQKQPVWFNDDKRRADKCGGDWFGSGSDCSLMRQMSSKSSARKAASAQIAKIPFTLSHYIANAYKPK